MDRTHFENFEDFFRDDEGNNISEKKLDEQEYNYLKEADSW